MQNISRRGSKVITGMLLLWGISCDLSLLPDAELRDERQREGRDGGYAGGSNHVQEENASPQKYLPMLMRPQDGAQSVPSNLTDVLFRWEKTGALDLATDEMVPHFILKERGGAASEIILATPEIVTCGASDRLGDAPNGLECFRAAIPAELNADVEYNVLTTVQKVSEKGPERSVEGAIIGWFRTAANADTAPPVISNLQIEPDAACLRLRFDLNETSGAKMFIKRQGETASFVNLGTGALRIDHRVALRLLSPSGVDGEKSAMTAIVNVDFEAIDLAGNQSRSPLIAVSVPVSLAAISITEVLANPAGKEPDQEFVEIRNIGEDSVNLEGFTIADAKGTDALPSVSLAPQEFALIVGEKFLEAPQSEVISKQDVPVKIGTKVIRVDSRLGRDGLSNAGEAVILKDKFGRVVSRYGGFVNVQATRFGGRSVNRVPGEFACDEPGSWSSQPAIPTPGWSIY